MKKNIIFIPARTGSTRIPNKNIQKLGSETLLSRKIKTCLKAQIGDVIVSTNSNKIKKYVEKFGAKCPYLRPSKYSTSRASMVSAILDYLRFLKKNKLEIPYSITICPVTNPFLKTASIKSAYKKFLKSKYTSLNAVTNPEDHPFLFVNIKDKIKFNVVKVNGLKWTDLERTQDWPESFISTSALRITKTSYFLKFLNIKFIKFNKKTCDPKSSTFYKIKKIESFDINDIYDIKLARFLLNSKK